MSNDPKQTIIIGRTCGGGEGERLLHDGKLHWEKGFL